jgi:hypothetical protein
MSGFGGPAMLTLAAIAGTTVAKITDDSTSCRRSTTSRLVGSANSDVLFP